MADEPGRSGWADQIPKLLAFIAGFIAFVLAAVQVVGEWEARPERVTGVVLVSLAGLIWLGCAYAWAKVTPPWRQAALAGLVVLPVGAVWVLLQPSVPRRPVAASPQSLAPAQPQAQTASSARSAEAQARLAPLDQAIQANPQSVKAYLDRGTAFYELRMAADAISDLEQAAKLDPNNASPHFLLGATHLLYTGDMDRAIQSFSRTIELQPGHVNAYSGRGEAYLRKGDLDKAIADYTTHITLAGSDMKAKPNLSIVYFQRGQLYQRQGDVTRARADFQAIIDALPPEADYRRQAEAQLKALQGQ